MTIRLGFLVPPGNPTLEPEMYRMAPAAVTVHFSRMVARGVGGSHQGQDERTRSQVEHIDESIALLAMAGPAVIALGHTATSYFIGQVAERELVRRIESANPFRFITAFGSVLAAFEELGIRKVAVGTPYNEATTLQGKAALEAAGLDVVRHGRLTDVKNIYLETTERAADLARSVDCADADGVFLSGVGMPTIAVLQSLEDELGKPVLSSAACTMWNSLRAAALPPVIPGYGRLLDPSKRDRIVSRRA